MSNPFVVGPSTSETATQSLPTFTEFAWDFIKDDFIYRRDGSHEIVTGKEAIKVWVLHVLRCERYRYLAYFDDYGIELEKFIGTGPNDGQRSSELFRYVKEGLMVNPYITDVTALQVTQEHKKITMVIHLETVYGEVEMGIEV